MKISRTVIVLSMAIAMSIAIPAFAESAPVYDADSSQFDESADQGQDLPPPPPPGQEGAYVPNQQQFVPMPEAKQQPPQRPAQPMSADQRLRRVEQQIENMQNSDNAERLNSLQDQVQSLRGQVEQLTRQLQQVQNQQKSMYTDLDKRLSQQNANNTNTKKVRNISPPDADSGDELAKNDTEEATDTTQAEPTPPKVVRKKTPSTVKPVVPKAAEPADNNTVVAAKSTVSGTQPNVAEEQEIYQTAYNMIKAKKYNDAVNALQGMLQKYPSGQFASNAHYWLGELYGLMGKNDKALSEFNAVVKTFPESPRVSDAQLKVGLILASQSKWGDAKTVFKKVINRYPGTASARLAAENLKQIKQAGH